MTFDLAPRAEHGDGHRLVCRSRCTVDEREAVEPGAVTGVGAVVGGGLAQPADVVHAATP